MRPDILAEFGAVGSKDVDVVPLKLLGSAATGEVIDFDKV